MPPATLVWSVLYCLACIAHGYWQRRHPASFLRWREASAAVLRMAGMAFGGLSVVCELVLVWA